MPTRLPALVVVAILAACQAPASQPAEVEVSGVAQAGPVCPVERQPPDPACADRPVSGAILVVTKNGDEVTRTTSAPDGTFHLRLAPGEYQLVVRLACAPTPPDLVGNVSVAGAATFSTAHAGTR